MAAHTLSMKFSRRSMMGCGFLARAPYLAARRSATLPVFAGPSRMAKPGPA
jgi:hypothetical protein